MAKQKDFFCDARKHESYVITCTKHIGTRIQGLQWRNEEVRISLNQLNYFDVLTDLLLECTRKLFPVLNA